MTTLPHKTFWRLNDWSVVHAAGPDAVKFMQGFCTNDVARLAEGEACEAFFTDVKAKVLAHGAVGRSAEGCDVVLTSPRAERLRSHLDRYLIREDVRLTASTEGVAVVSEALPSGVGRGVSIVPLDCLGEGAAALVGDGPRLLSVVEQLQGQGWRRAGADELDRYRILRGVPRDGVDVDERNLPQEVDRNETAISFTKGCYLGQEPVARIDALGRVNRLLRGLVVEGTATTAPGTPVMSADREVGRITSATTHDGRLYALAYLRREQAEAGVALEADHRSAVVSDLPFAG